MTNCGRSGATRPRAASIAWPAAVVLVLGLTVGCGADDVSGGDAGGLSVTEAWARPTPPGSDRTAIYATIGNNGSEADRLTGVVTDRCSTAELHATVIDDAGVAGMRPADDEALSVAPGGELVLEPGGLHAMCVGLAAPLADGDTFDATFTFESGSTVAVEVEVADAQT